MKKLLAFLVLLSHMNFSMFIPQVDEMDLFDANGTQTDDINSLFEYVDQVVLGNKNDTPQDEDDDNARYFHLVKMNDYAFQQQVIELKKATPHTATKTNYPPYLEQKLSSLYFDIQSPPPEV